MVLLLALVHTASAWTNGRLLIWMDADRTILHIEKAVPPCRADPCPGYGTMRLVSFVLETRSGTADREGLKTGDRMSIVFPGEAGDLR